METLFSMTESMRQLVSLADSLEPEDQETFADTLEAVKGEIGLKLDSYAYVMEQIEARKDMLKKIADQAADKAASCEKAIEKMKQAAYDAVSQTPPDAKGKQSIEGDVYKFSIVKNGGRQPMEITGDVPEAYQKIVLEPDKERIRKALEDGKELEFAHLKPRGTHLQIK